MTRKDLQKTKCAHLNPWLWEEEEKVKKQRKPRRPSKHVTWMHETIKEWCEKKGLVFHNELKFHDFRKFRFDWAVTDQQDHKASRLKIAVEYQGLQSAKSGHTTLLGYTKDTDKSNLAQSEGWTVLAFTVMNYRNVIVELEKYIL